MELTFEQVVELIKSLGLVKGVFVAFFFLAHTWLHLANKGRLADRQKEIDRLAADNSEYRTRLLALMDKNFGYVQPKKKPIKGGK